MSNEQDIEKFKKSSFKYQLQTRIMQPSGHVPNEILQEVGGLLTNKAADIVAEELVKVFNKDYIIF